MDAPRPLLLKKVGESGESKPVWAHPLDLDSLYSLIQTYPNANKKFVVGNTTNGIWPDTGLFQKSSFFILCICVLLINGMDTLQILFFSTPISL